MTEQVQYSDEEIKLQIKRGMTGRDGRGNMVNVWLRLERAKTMIAYNMMQLTSELNGNLERLAIYGRGLSDILDENIIVDLDENGKESRNEKILLREF